MKTRPLQIVNDALGNAGACLLHVALIQGDLPQRDHSALYREAEIAEAQYEVFKDFP